MPKYVSSAISIHALREEGDICSAYPSQTAGRFLSTPSARRATDIISRDAYARLFLSTPSARRATSPAAVYGYALEISIHALREEGDTIVPSTLAMGSNFYPRPPRGGRLFFC